MAKLARDVHADAGGTEERTWCRPLRGDRSVVAPSAEVPEVRRIVLSEANRPLVEEGVGALAIDFEEAYILLGDVPGDQGAKERVGEVTVQDTLQRGVGNARAGEGCAVEALPARIE